MTLDERLDRQMRIEGWNQDRLSNSKIAVIGNDKILSYLYVLSASALGINNQLIINPYVNKTLLDITKRVNPEAKIADLRGYFSHREMSNLLKNCSAIIDLSNYDLAKKLLVEISYTKDIPLIMVNCEDGYGKIFQYSKGREFKELEEMITSKHLPTSYEVDPILSIIISGLVLEETKNILMKKKTSEDIVKYMINKENKVKKNMRVLIVGAGALGNFVGMGLGYIGINNIDIIDPDVIERTNLNRQILFYDKVGEPKALVLAERINKLFKTNAKGMKKYFEPGFNINKYDVVFDCVDNFETRIVMSEMCKEEGKILISGGTTYDAGQVVCYVPGESKKTPAELLGLYEIVKGRENKRRERASCSYVPNPSVIMSNQIIAGVMVDILRNPKDKIVFYDALSNERIVCD